MNTGTKAQRVPEATDFPGPAHHIPAAPERPPTPYPPTSAPNTRTPALSETLRTSIVTRHTRHTKVLATITAYAAAKKRKQETRQ